MGSWLSAIPRSLVGVVSCKMVNIWYPVTAEAELSLRVRNAHQRGCSELWLNLGICAMTADWNTEWRVSDLSILNVNL